MKQLAVAALTAVALFALSMWGMAGLNLTAGLLWIVQLAYLKESWER